MRTPADNPIRWEGQDRLGRTDLAKAFAGQILSLDASEGAAVGVLGAWGSGKTSFVNLASSDLDAGSAAYLEFNPWMFSGADQLVERFFNELAAQLKPEPQLGRVAEGLTKYGEAFTGLAWLPLVGPWMERGRVVSKLISILVRRRKTGVRELGKELRESLEELKSPIVVFIDDVDRLSSTEIRDVFKLIRLTASFPNLIYVVAFDRIRVEAALEEQGVPGREYLEKILHLAVDLPEIPEEVLRRETLAAIDAALEGLERLGPFDANAWPDLFVEVVWPLIRHMRDVRRYAVAVRGTVKSLHGRVALADVLALEAIRVFLPHVFARLPVARAGLTTVAAYTSGYENESPALKASIESLLEAGGDHALIVKAMVERMFPAAVRHIGGTHFGPDRERRWLRERRVAHSEILGFYLERAVGQGLQAFEEAEVVFALLDDRGALEEYIAGVEHDSLQDLIVALESFEDAFRPEHVAPASTVLLNSLGTMPDRSEGMFSFGPRLAVTRVVLRLLRRLPDPQAVEESVRAVLPELATLYAELTLLRLIGHEENAGHQLVSQEAADRLMAQWRERVRDAPADRLVQEQVLLDVLLTTVRSSGDDELPIEVPNSPDHTTKLLEDARGEVRSQTLGSRVVHRATRLHWEVLVEVAGGEDALRKRLAAIPPDHPRRDDELMALAERYLSGWRPDPFLDDEHDERA